MINANERMKTKNFFIVQPQINQTNNDSLLKKIIFSAAFSVKLT